MPAPEATLRWSDQELTKSAQGWTATMAWDVINVTTELQAVAATGYDLARTHPQTTRLRVQSIGGTRPGFTAWLVKASFGEANLNNNPSNDPTQDPPRISWSKGSITLARTRDWQGNRIQTSARTLPIKQSTYTKFTRFVTLTRNEPFFNAPIDVQFEDTCNKDVVTIQGLGSFKPGMLAFVGYEPVGDFAFGDPFVKTARHFEIRDGDLDAFDNLYNGFKESIPDVSLTGFAKDSTGNKVNMTFRSGGIDVTEPVKLNGTGIPIDPAVKVYFYDPVSQGAPPGSSQVGGIDTSSVDLQYTVLTPTAYAGLLAGF